MSHEVFTDDLFGGGGGGVPDGHTPNITARVMLDSNIDLSVAADPNPVDGVTVLDGEVVFLNGQTDAKEKGPYVATTAADPTTWVRHEDFDEDSEILYSAKITVTEGTEYNDSLWLLSSDKASIGVDNLNFVRYGDGAFIEGSSGGIKRRDEGATTGNTRDRDWET